MRIAAGMGEPRHVSFILRHNAVNGFLAGCRYRAVRRRRQHGVAREAGFDRNQPSIGKPHVRIPAHPFVFVAPTPFHPHLRPHGIGRRHRGRGSEHPLQRPVVLDDLYPVQCVGAARGHPDFPGAGSGRLLTHCRVVDGKTQSDAISRYRITSSGANRLPYGFASECRRVHAGSSLAVMSGIPPVMVGASQKPEFVPERKSVRDRAPVLPGTHGMIHGVGAAVPLRPPVPRQYFDDRRPACVEMRPVYPPEARAVTYVVRVDHHVFTLKRLVQFLQAVAFDNFAVVARVIDVVVAVRARMPLVAEKRDEPSRAVVLCNRLLHHLPITSQTCESLAVIVDNVTVPISIRRHVVPRRMPHHRTEVQMLARQPEGPLETAVTVADPTVRMQVSPEQRMVHRSLT